MAALVLTAGTDIGTLHTKQWQATVGADSPDRGSQAIAFLPNELWVHAGDSIRWTLPTHERHTLTFLQPGQVRPPGFGPVFVVPVGCPGLTPDRSPFDGSACVTTGVLLVGESPNEATSAPTYTVTFPAAGNFKFVCLVHADMTGVVHVLNLPPGESGSEASSVAAGGGEIVTTTGRGSQTASLMRFLRGTIVIQVGDTVEWTMLDPSINDTVSFGAEPVDPRPPSANVTTTSDGARQAVIASPEESVNSGFLTMGPQDRPGLPQSPPGPRRFRVTFTVPGAFNYICAIHDQLGLRGTVIVHH